jgi:hypothetical protein
MSDYSKIQLQLEASNQHLHMGKVLDSIEALSTAFYRARELSGARFRLYSADIWNRADNIALTNSGNVRARIQVTLLQRLIENEVSTRNEPVVFSVA